MLIPSFLTVGATELQAAVVPVPIVVPMSVDQSVMSRWCWAAVAVGVAEKYDGYSDSQCQVANRVIGNQIGNHIECCPQNESCNSDELLSDAMNQHFAGFDDPSRTSLKFVIDELGLMHPVPARMAAGNDGHYLVIAAYWSEQGDDYFGVWDPNYPMTKPWRTLVASFRQNYDLYWSWDYSYRTK